jgi:hypothetical protein
MKKLTTSLLGMMLISHISLSQNQMTLKDWSFIADSNIVVLFARNEFHTNYLVVPIESYFLALENYLFKNHKMINVIEELNIEFIYDECIFNEEIGDAYLVFNESSLHTSYGEDLRYGEHLYPYNCITEILFNESLREKPEFIITDDTYLSYVKRNVRNSEYQSGTWLDSTFVLVEKGPKIKMNSKNKRSKRWLSYQLNLPYGIDYITNKPMSLETNVRIRKLPKMWSYNSVKTLSQSEIENYGLQIVKYSE